MAIRKGTKRSLSAVVIVSEHDDSIDAEKSNIDEYKKTADLAHLVFVADKQPTRFLCNFELSAKQAASVKNGMIAGKGDDGEPTVTLGSWAHRVVKHTLRDIQNPSDLPVHECIVFKKDENGHAHDDVIAELERQGVVDEIFGFYTRLAMGGAKQAAKN